MNKRQKLVFVTVSCVFAVALQAQQPARDPAGNVANGEALFFGKAGCAGCHEVNGRGGIVGPDLSAAGTRFPEALRAKILNPSDVVGRGGLSLIIKTQDGREVRGVRRNEDTFTLQMVDASGQLHLLEKNRLAEVRYDDRSLMPADYATRLGQDELRDVIAYLGTLKGRDANKTAAVTPGGVTYDRLRNSDAEPHNWMHYWGNYEGTHYSALNEITSDNVSRLQAQWSIQLPGP